MSILKCYLLILLMAYSLKPCLGLGKNLDSVYSTNSPNMILDSLIFKDGKEKYYSEIRKLVYPKNALINEVQGTMIFQLTIKPDGTKDALILTDLGDDINAAVATLMNGLKDQFLVKDTDYTVYQALFFSLHHDFTSSFKENLDGFKDNFSFPWLEPATIALRGMARSAIPSSATGTRVGSSSTSNRLPPGSSMSPGQSEFSEGYQLRNYLSYFKRYEKFSEKGNTKRAYKSVTELIKYNPFALNLIETRRKLESELGLSDYKKYDEALISILEQK
jgi:hypothetical protein